MVRLFDQLEAFEDRPALITLDDETVSYADLLSVGKDLIAPLGAARRLVIVEMAPALEPIAVYVALLRAGHVAILAAPDREAWERIALGVSPNFVYRRGPNGWGFEARSQAPLQLHEELAVLLSTSGSTGSPKLVRLSHSGLIANSGAIAQYLEFSPGERAFMALPLYFSYGMSVLNAHLLAGECMVLNEHSVITPCFWDRLRRHGATSLTGVPHTYELLEQSRHLDEEAPTLRYFACGGGRLAPEKVSFFARRADARGQRFYVTYGQTEGGPRMAYLPPQDAARRPECIGRAIPGGALRIEPPGADSGELVFSGPSIMMGYAECSDDLARPREITELHTGDIAACDEDGYFRIIGRSSRFCKLFGLRVALDDVEMMLAKAGRQAVVAGDDEGLVVATTQLGSTGDLVAQLADRLRLPASCIAVVEVSEIPRHGSGKVDYPAVLKLRAAPPADPRKGLRSEIGHLLGVRRTADDDTFISLGGDSLSYVQASLLLERRLGHVPDGWETTPMRDLEHVGKPFRPRVFSLETSVVLRALAIVAVVLHHAMGLGVSGAAASLFLLAGVNFSRFKLPQLLKGRSTALAKSLALGVIAPYFIAISIYSIASKQIYWPQYLLFSNFTNGLMINGHRRFSTYWFIEAYIDLLLALYLIFLAPGVRAAASRRPTVFAMSAFVLAFGVALCGKVLSGWPVFQPATPISLAYLFVFGWLIDRWTGTLERAALAAAGSAIFYILLPPALRGGFPVLAAGLLALLFVRRAPVGRPLGHLLSALAAASLYIYIFHGLAIHLARVALGRPIGPWEAPVVAAIGIGVGVALWRAVEFAKFGRLRTLRWPKLPALRAGAGERTSAERQAPATVLRSTIGRGAPRGRWRLLLHEASFQRVAGKLPDCVHPLLVDAEGQVRDGGKLISAREAQPHAAWCSHDLIGHPRAQAFWTASLASRQLQWVHTDAAGTDGGVYRSVEGSGAALTTNNTQAGAIAEYIIGEVLAFNQRISERRQAQAQRLWSPSPFREIADSRWLVIGFGAIGQAVARRVKPFGATVIGVRRRPEPHPDADAMLTLTDVAKVLPYADVVVLALPSTAETNGVADRNFFKRMKQGSILVNVGRGGAIDEVALLEALANGAPERAILDVFKVEPLPRASALWTNEQVIVTAHTAGMGASRTRRSDALFLENLARFTRGEALNRSSQVHASHPGLEQAGALEDLLKFGRT